MQKNKIFWIFGLFNLAVLLFAGFFWILPSARSLQIGRESVRLLKRSYASAREILHTEPAAPVFRQEELLPVLAEISGRGGAYGLEMREFSTGEMTNLAPLSYNENFYELRATADYIGEFGEIINFLRDFPDSHGYIRSFSVIKEGDSQLRLQFSIFGVG